MATTHPIQHPADVPNAKLVDALNALGVKDADTPRWQTCHNLMRAFMIERHAEDLRESGETPEDAAVNMLHSVIAEIKREEGRL